MEEYSKIAVSLLLSWAQTVEVKEKIMERFAQLQLLKLSSWCHRWRATVLAQVRAVLDMRSNHRGYNGGRRGSNWTRENGSKEAVNENNKEVKEGLVWSGGYSEYVESSSQWCVKYSSQIHLNRIRLALGRDHEACSKLDFFRWFECLQVDGSFLPS